MCNLNFRHFITGFQSCVVELYNQQLHSYCTMSNFKSTLLANAIEVKTMFNGFDPIQCFGMYNTKMQLSCKRSF